MKWPVLCSGTKPCPAQLQGQLQRFWCLTASLSLASAVSSVFVHCCCCRYAVGKLYVLGLFEEVECANFITIATPHLGSWR
jgi:hypothetical protein